jgi:hypothetical protein
MFRLFKIILLCLGLAGFVSAQDSVFVFKVSKPKSYINITPNDLVLLKGKMYLFNVWVSEGKSVVSFIKADSLLISRENKTQFSVYVPKNTQAIKTTLQVYEKKEDGSIVLAELKEYQIVESPKPTIYIGGVKADSLIDKKHLYEYSNLEARFENWKIPVLSFEMIAFSNGVEQKFTSNNNKLTVAMKHFIQRLEPGKMISFTNIKCLMPNGEVEVIENVRLFFDETNLYKVGERIIYNGN